MAWQWGQEHEWRRLYDATKELMRAVGAGEADVSGPEGWVWTDISRALERIRPPLPLRDADRPEKPKKQPA